ncbi:MAG TPA: hypothetical protein VIG99_12675 [Myxococcaceae bacterium]
MPRTFQHLLLTSALALALAPGAAHARFGKSDDRDKNEQQHQNNNNGGGGGGDSSTTPSRSSGDSHYHEATPVGVPDHPRGRGCESDGCCWRQDGIWPAYWYEPAPAYVGYAGYNQEVRSAPGSGWRIRTELTGDLMGFRTMDGGAAAAQLRIEGPKWGIALEGRTIAVNADDGSNDTDHLSFFNGFVTYALVGNERGRLRLEAGGQSAFAPDLIVLSPAVGVSFAFGFGDHFGLEGVARASVYPHTQVELAAGLTYSMGPLGLRLGMRGIYLNDRGWVDGVTHDDFFSGPYFGVGMAF